MLASLAALGLVLAAPAGAVIDLEAEGVVWSELRLHGSHGYEIAVGAFGAQPAESGEPGHAGAVTVTVHRRGEAARYSVPATVTSDSIHADLGSLGEIDLTLHRSGHKRVVHSKCLRDSIRYEPGVYEGTLRFRGEGGYTGVSRTAARRVLPIPLGPCSGSGSGENSGDGLPGARLRGLSFAHGRTLRFQFNKNRPRARVVYSASVRERRGDLRISRTVEGTAAPAAFQFAGNLSSASLRPPSPFFGSAELRRPPNSVTAMLRGDLDVAFPGRTIALTGRDVTVTMAHARLTFSDSSTVSIGF